MQEPNDCLSYAFWEGYPCWHKATLEIVENYLQIEALEQTQIKETVASVDTSGVTGVNSFTPLQNPVDHPTGTNYAAGHGSAPQAIPRSGYF